MRRNNVIYTMVMLALLIGLVFVLDLTVGAVSLGPLSITLVGIPVAIATCVFGPIAGIILGFFWGLTSLIKGLTGMDVMGVQLLSINAFGTVFTCFVPRMLVGLLSGLIYKINTKWDKKGYINSMITSGSVALLNPILFLSSLCLFFWNTDYIKSFREYYNTDNVIVFIALVASWNALLELAVNLFVGSACVFGVNKAALALGVRPLFGNKKED